MKNAFLPLVAMMCFALTASGQSGCMNPWACNYDETATTDDGSCDLESCFGCTVLEALNYEPSATRDDGSCDFTGLWGCTYGYEYGGTVPCSQTASNYNPDATWDDGSCIWELTPSCKTDLNCDGQTDTQDLLALIGEFGTDCFSESSDSFTSNLGSTAKQPPFPQVLPDLTCNHPQACNYDPNAPEGNVCDWTSCAGCHYEIGCNYSGPVQTTYIQCTFDCPWGCTYADADNYDASAQFDDGSCIFPVNSCPPDLNGNGDVDTPDLLICLGEFGTTCLED